MKIFDHEDWEKWNDAEKHFMLSLMTLQMKINRIDKAMRDNVAYHDETIGNPEDLSEYEEYIVKLYEHTPTLKEMVETLDEILDDI
jgi:hypothetical protein